MYYLMPVILFFSTFLCGLFLRRLVLGRIAAYAKTTQTQLDDVVAGALRMPMLLWCLMLAVYVTLRYSGISDNVVSLGSRVLIVLGLISVTMALADILSSVVKLYERNIEGAFPVTSLTQNVARIVVYIVGGLIVLNHLGISIAPILATLGIGGLAVALALQDTLSNLFAGFHVAASRQIRVGDYIMLDGGQEGYVTDIGWRTTKIKMTSNSVILVPNSKLSQAIVTNHYLPDRELAVLIDVGVHYDSDLEHVERVTCEVAKKIMQETAGGVSGFEPFIRYNKFADFCVGFTVILRGKEFTDQYLIKHAFIKALHARYKKENIIIPYPISAINLSQEKANIR